MNYFIPAVVKACICLCTLILLNSCSTFQVASSFKNENQVQSSHIKNQTAQLNDINMRAVRSFVKSFKIDSGVSWHKVKGGFVAEFMKDSSSIVAAYDYTGTCNYKLKRYAENKMPADLRAIVKSHYYDYVITLVTEILIPAQSEDIVYNVSMKAGHNYKTVQVCNGEMLLLSDYSE